MKPGPQPSTAQAAQPPRARPRDASVTRAALLRAASEEFAERGFAGARVDEIADRAHVNKRMIYVHFGDKRRLFREVLRVRLSRPRTPRRRGADAPCAVRERVAAYFHLLARDPPLARLFAWAMLFGNGRREHALLLAAAERGLRPLDDAIRSGIGSGAFRADLDPEPVRSALFAACVGYFLQHDAMRSAVAGRATGVSDEAFLEGLCRVLLDGILARDPPPGGPASALARIAQREPGREQEG